jgi:hypothetical protein
MQQFIRWSAYLSLSMLSGVAWGGIFLWIAGWGEGRSAISSDTALVFGAIAGLVVGSVMQYFYRKPDLMITVLTAPLAMWLGMCCFLFLSGVNFSYEHGGPISIFGPMYMAFVALFIPPGLLLIPLALVNGLLLRLVLISNGRQRPADRVPKSPLGA